MAYDKEIQELVDIREHHIGLLKRVSNKIENANTHYELLQLYKEITFIRNEIEICSKKIELIRMARFRYLMEYKKYIEK